MVGESRNVVFTFPKRGKKDGKDIESVKEILAESALSRKGSKILVGRRDDPRLGGSELRSPHWFIFFGFQHAQQLSLNFQAKVGDIIEKERAMAGDLKNAGLVLSGPCESPFDVPKQLAFQQRR